MADQPGDPVDIVFDAARNIAERGMRSHQHHHVREAVDQDPEKSLRPALPFVFQPNAVHAPDIDPIEAAGDGVEAGCIDDDVERVFAIAGLDAFWRDPQNRCFGDIHQFDMVLVVGLVISGFQRHAAGAEAVVLGNEFFRGPGIVHPLADFPGDEVADGSVGLSVGHDVTKIALPDGEAGLGIEFFEERLALLIRHLKGAARIRRMDETSKRFQAALEYPGIVGLDFLLRLRVDLAVVQRRAPVRRALEHRQMPDAAGDGLNGLHAGGAGPDYCNPLAGEVDRFVRPSGGVEGLALEFVYALDPRHGGGGERANGGDQETGAEAAAVLQRDVPVARFLLPTRRGDPAFELDVASQIELVGDEIEVSLRLRLAGEMLGPIPFLQQLLRKRIAVGVALGIEARARIAVPVPGATDPGAGFEHAHPHPEFAQPVELVHARHAGPDDDGIEVCSRHRVGRSQGFAREGHLLLFPG